MAKATPQVMVSEYGDRSAACADGAQAKDAIDKMTSVWLICLGGMLKCSAVLLMEQRCSTNDVHVNE
jgi:hypothetical protein